MYRWSLESSSGVTHSSAPSRPKTWCAAAGCELEMVHSFACRTLAFLKVHLVCHRESHNCRAEKYRIGLRPAGGSVDPPAAACGSLRCPVNVCAQSVLTILKW